MSFAHLAGVTTPGAPDEVVDWFTTFEAWITATVGWTVALGAGTTDMVLQSDGEAGGHSIFAHVRRNPGNPNQVLFDVQDDAIGTHVTTSLAMVDSGGVQFAFWMTADKNAMLVVWKLGAGYTMAYAGLVEPFALGPVTDPHRMIAAGRISFGTILQDHNNLWDRDYTIYDDTEMDDNMFDRKDGSLSLCGLIFNHQNNCAGELYHISGQIREAGVNPEDTLDTGIAGETATWICLSDSIGWRFAMRTGGTLPTGRGDGTFAHTSGNCIGAADFINNILTPFMTGLGWTDQGSAGIYTISRQFYSQGEDGTEDIYVVVAYNLAGAQGHYYVRCQNDAAGTHITERAARMDPADYPANYWISGDKDCVVFTNQRAGGYDSWWGGMVNFFAQNLPDSTYKMVVNVWGTVGLSGCRILNGHNDVWNALLTCWRCAAASTNSSPNAYDGLTYIVWPQIALVQGGGVAAEPIGDLKYLCYASGGGIANLDTITVGAVVYTVFFDTNGQPWLMRTA